MKYIYWNTNDSILVILFEDNLYNRVKEKDKKKEREKEEIEERIARNVISRRERIEVSRRSVFAETRGILAKYAEEERRRETEEEREAAISLVGHGRTRGETGRGGVRAPKRAAVFTRRARASACNARLFVVVRFVPRARRDHSVVADYATRGHESAPRSRECSRARARIVAQDWRDYRYLAMCLQQQIWMRKLLNFQASSLGYHRI